MHAMPDHAVGGTNRTIYLRLLVSFCLNAAIACVEIVAGIASGSIALIADAVHNLGDAFALALSLISHNLGRRPPTLRHSYGLKRAEILAAFCNALMLAVLAMFIIEHALSRLMRPEGIHAPVTILVAIAAIVVNSASVLLLRHHDHDDLNVRAAVLHLLQDVFSSLIVVISASLAETRIGMYLDPAAAIVIGVAVVLSALSILRGVLITLLESVPDGIQLEELAQSTEARFPGTALHHLHVWQVGPKQNILTAHLLIRDMKALHAEMLCNEIRDYLKEEWGIRHVTLEPEVKGCGSETLLGKWQGNGCGSDSDSPRSV